DSIGSPLDSATSIADTFFTWQYNLQDSTKYFWKVKAVDPYGEIAWCNETQWWFYINTQVGIHRKPEENQVIPKFEIFPNPSNGNIIISYQMPRKEKKHTLEFYDISGRLIKCLKLTSKKCSGTIIWNGKDSQGQPAPPGIYFLKLDNRTVGKVVKVK
ncbi:unnamed protein product, partial [marine sediment metagenome]